MTNKKVSQLPTVSLLAGDETILVVQGGQSKKMAVPQAMNLRFTDLSGTLVNMTKVASGIVTPNTGNGYSINISGAGFTNIIGYNITPIKSTVIATSVPKISVKSVSTTAIVVNIIEGNSSTINLLGSLVLLGTSEQFVDVSGLTLNVIVYGN